MKALTPATANKILSRENIEPITLVKIELGGAVGTLYYADREITLGGIKWLASIITIGQISGIRNQTSGTYNSLSITLNDTDLFLYSKLNSIQFCTKKVTVFEHFADLGANDPITLLVGELSTPISWKEADRTLSFEISTKIRSLQAGYSPLNILLTQQAIIGKSMPLCFGTVYDIPCEILQRPRQAELFDDVLFNDMNPYVIGTKSFRIKENLYWSDNVPVTLLIGTIKFNGHFVGNTFFITEKKIEHLVYKGFDSTDAHKIYVTETNLNVVGQRISVLQRAQFNSNEFHQQKYIVQMQTTAIDAFGNKQTVLILDHPIAQVAAAIDSGLQAPDANADILVLPTLTWTVFKAGTIIYQEGFTETILCANSIPSTTILAVQAYQQITLNVGGTSRSERNLAQLDPSYYTVNLNYVFDGQHLTIITLHNSLSYYQQGWEGDTIYVSLISSVGNNTSDIIRDIVQRYTPLTIDANSFGLVKSQLTNYPSDFAIFSTKDALVFIGEICWQARCAYDIVNNVVFLKYLGTEPFATLVINDNDIAEATVEYGYTKVEDIITQLIAKYKLSYSEKAIEQNLVYNANQTIYGLRRSVYDFYIYTNTACVQKTLTFWGNRLSNQWREINLKTFVRGLVCDVFDCVEMTIDGVNNKGIVDETEYDTLNHEVKFRFWTPVLAGTSTQSSLAWLSDSTDLPPAAPQPALTNKGSILIYPVGDWSWRNNDGSGNTGNALLGIVTGVNIDGTFIADIYSDGYQQPPTEFSVLVNLIDRRRKHKIGDKILCVKIGPLYYNATDNASSPVLLAKVITANDGAYTVDIYREGFDDGVETDDQNLTLHLLDETLILEVDQKIAVVEVTTENNTEVWCLSSKSGADLTVGGEHDTEVIDGEDKNNKGFLSDIFKIVDNKLCLDLESLHVANIADVAVPFSDIFTVTASNKLAIKTSSLFTDETNAAPMELTLDVDKYRPSATMLKD